jgi:DNA polymerase I-like protein with 3'-5' exonuclease and polymerase domains
LKYLEADENYWACDIEADDLLEKATRVWCCCVENIETGEKRVFTDDVSFRGWYNTSYVMVGHNFIVYDLPMLNRHWKVGIPITKVVDTFVLSQLYNPTFNGGHSLSAWGQRLRFLKGEFNDFTKLSEDMLKYCARDTSLTRLLYQRLSSRMRSVGFTEVGCELEHLSWNIIQNKQRRHGFPFDKRKAEELYAILRSREEQLKQRIYTLWPPQLLVVAEYTKSRKQNGERTANYLRHSGQYPKLEDTPEGGYRCYDYVAFNLGSPKQRVSKLLELGWTPTQWTIDKVTKEKKNPKIDEESILAFAEECGKEEVSCLARWLVVNSRANMVRTWLDAVNEETGCIHGRLFIASTLRYRHSNPNSANIPAVKTGKEGKVLYGEEGTWAYECRDLFTAGQSDDYVLVGVDAKGIQLRVLANYAYSEEFAASVLSGDPHTKNIQVLGLANKPAAKKFLYTTLMGGGGAKLAADQAQFGTKLTEREGNALKQKLIDSVPGFRELIDSLQEELERTGRIRLCDGTPILVPSPHMVIPYLLQGDESRIMKKASVLLDREIRRAGIQAAKVADIHDEWQFVVRNEDVQRFVDRALSVFPEAGRSFNYRVPIEGDAKIGKTWAETH